MQYNQWKITGDQLQTKSPSKLKDNSSDGFVFHDAKTSQKLEEIGVLG